MPVMRLGNDRDVTDDRLSSHGPIPMGRMMSLRLMFRTGKGG